MKNVFSNFNNPFSEITDNLKNKFYHLPTRDKHALQVLMVFFIFMLFYAVFWVHKTANKSESSALATQQQLFWMRAQASNINTDHSANKPLLENFIQQSAMSQNIMVNTVANGSSVQFSASHENAVVLGAFLSRLQQGSVKFQRITMHQKPSLDVTLEATASY